MSAKKCSRCDKTVYPIEELKCLDKVWHKSCFKCQECNMALNMKTYKGFNKLPYCNAHCPQARATAVADTPESRRLAENTKLQSQVKYHEDFERQKGKLTQVADDPETLRIRNASKMISNVAYHGELEKKQKMEERRTLMPDEIEIKNGFETQKPQQMPTNAPKAVITDGNKNANARQQQNVSRTVAMDAANHNMQNSGGNQYHHMHHERLTQPPNVTQMHTNNVSKDNSPYTAKLQSTVIYTSDQGPVNENSRKVGSIADYDPINDNYGSIASGYKTGGQNSAFFAGGPHPQMVTQVATNNVAVRRAIGRTFRAMYDYTAQDVDEVSFIDGDIMINCQPIDEGWMTGTVQRTGQTGMLPSNYVEPYN